MNTKHTFVFVDTVNGITKSIPSLSVVKAVVEFNKHMEANNLTQYEETKDGVYHLSPFFFIAVIQEA